VHESAFGTKQTSPSALHMSANDPKRTLQPVCGTRIKRQHRMDHVLPFVIGTVLLVLLAAAASGYSVFRPIHRYDRVGASVFFIVVGLPVGLVGLALIALYVRNATN